ncbi:MAG: sensor histidine kinase [Bacteroidetes bacterium]|nr:MAG: sensor histidine kinase [Bacteroidota bacterium]
MKRTMTTFLILGALTGLMWVQFRLLIIGTKLEKQKFDQKIERVLFQFRQTLETPAPPVDTLIRIIRAGIYDETPVSDSAQVVTMQFLEKWLDGHFREAGISARFTFAVKDPYSDRPVFQSPGFADGREAPAPYEVALSDYVMGGCHCEQVFSLRISNLFGVLLGELNYLTVPSGLCVAAILAGVFFLFRNLKKEERLNAVKNDFINNLTHELKTPVFSISVALKLLREKTADRPELHPVLDLMTKEKDRLGDQIEKVLELASLESGRYRLERKNADPHALLCEVADRIRPVIQSRSGRLSLDLHDSACNLSLDATHFKNVVQNLLDNAVKYTPGAPDILVKTRVESGFWVVSVRDNGPGIAAKYHRAVFEKFFRVPTGNRHDVKGFGLGLHYVEQVVKAHGGFVRLESVPGGGSVFRVAFPLKA